MSLEELKSKTKIKLTVMSISMLLPIIIIVVMGLGQWKIGESKSVFFEAPWVPYTVCAIFLGYLVYKNVNYIRILKCEEYANKVLIAKNDERNRCIKLNAKSLSSKIFIYAVGVVAIFCAFIDYQYFFTCIVIFAGYLVIYYLVILYYSKKF